MSTFLRCFLALAVAIGVGHVQAKATSEKAPLREAKLFGKKPIADEKGDVYYIVDLTKDEQEKYSDERTDLGKARFHERHSGKAQNMVEAFEKQYGFEYQNMTSWVGNSFSAYLNHDQVEKLRSDPRVELVSEVIAGTVSALWSPTYNSPGSQTLSWGRNAVNGKISNNTKRVYVLDLGVGYHYDLQNVVARVNPTCNYGTNNHGNCAIPPVGCYSHGTHVAGIIGAAYDSQGVAGVNAGAKIISVSFAKENLGPGICSKTPAGGIDTASIQTGMDWIKWDIIVNGSGVGIVNMSFNDGLFSPNNTLHNKMLDFITPYYGAYYYPGAFVAQSAGNQGWNLNGYFGNGINGTGATFGYYDGPKANDGVMVVGAINDLGQPVTSANGGFSNYPLGGDEPNGSNYGAAVEVWAPGKGILSTFGPLTGFNPSNSSTWQRDGFPYSNYGNLSGTSMAAPHLAGVAAYLAETQQLLTPGAIELAVRNLFYSTGQYDNAGLPVKLVRLP